MKIRSKSFALLLSLAMFFAYMPAFAFADDTPSGGSSESGAAVAQIGDVKYATLKEAAAAASGKSVTIELLADTSLDQTTHTATEGYEVRFPADVDSVTINGNGHSITLAGAPEGYSWPNEAGSSPAGFTFAGIGPNDSAPAGKSFTFNKVHFVNKKDASKVSTGANRSTKYIYARGEKDEFNNCIFDGGVVVYGNAEFNGCTLSGSGDADMYALFVDHQYGGGNYTYSLKDCKISAPETAYGCVKVAADEGATVDVAMKSCVIDSKTKNKPAVYVNKATNLSVTGSGTSISTPAGIDAIGVKAGTGKIAVRAGTFTSKIPDEYLPEGVSQEAKSDGTYGVLDDADAVVAVGTKKFASLPEAVAAAKDGDTITLLKDAEGNGVKLIEKEAKKLTFDFGGHTYAMNGKAVGSTGYESQAMHFEKGSTITLKNGTLKVVGGKMGIQNYADLTLQDFNVDSSMNDKCLYALSCNNGDVKILGSSSLKAAEGKNAFDVCVTTNYPDGARVTVDTTGEIVGNVQYDVWKGIPENNKTGLTIKNGKFSGKFDVEEALKDAAKEKFSISGGTFTDSAAENYVSEGFFLTKNENGTYGVLDDADAVAAVGTKKFVSLPEAVAAAKDGDTITLLKDAEGNGVKLIEKEAKKLTFDFGGHTYAMNGKAVGSTGYESQAMHFEKGSTITLKNGTLKVVGGKMGVQNYANLTLQDFNVDSSMNKVCEYALSCNNGDIKILGSSSIKAAEGQNAFDVCVTTNYPDGARVTVDTTGEIVGNIEYDVWDGIPETNKTGLTIKNGKFDGKFNIEDALKDAAKEKFSISGGTFTDTAAAKYVADGFFLTKNEEGTYSLKDDANVIASVGEMKYESLPEAVAAAKDGDTITLLKDAEGNGVKLLAKDAKKLTFDFDGHTYTMNGRAVGSTGYESQAMHFEKGATIILKNGTLKVAGGKMGIQNYANLTLQDFNVDSSMNDKCSYALSCNNGDIKILGSSSIKAAEGQNAFDVCVTTNYPDGARATVDTTGEIVGNIQYDVWGGIPETNKTGLTIKNGKFNGKFDVEDALKDAAKEKFSISGGTFSEEVPEAYLADGFSCIESADGTYGVVTSGDAVRTLKEEKAKAEADAKAAQEALAKSNADLKAAQDELAKAKTETADAKAETEQAKKDLAEAQKAKQEADARAEGAENDKNTSEAEKAAAIAAKEKAEKEALDAKADLAKAQAAQAVAEAKQKEAEEKTAKAEADKAAAEAAKATAEAERDAAIAKQQAAEDKSAEAQENLNKALDALKNAQDAQKAAEDKADAAQTELNTTKEDLSKAKQDLATLTEKLTNAEKAQQAAEKAKADAEKARQDAEAQIAAAKKEAADAKAETEQAKKDLAEAQKAKQDADTAAQKAINDKTLSDQEKNVAIGEAKAAKENLQKALGDLEAAKLAQGIAEGKIESYEAKVKQAEADEETAKGKLLTAQAALNTALDEKAEAERLLGEANDKLSAAETARQKAEEDLKTANESLKTLQAQLDAAKAKADDSDKQLKETQASLEAAKKELDEAKKANAANEERIRQLEAELAAEKAKNAAKPAAPAKSSISKLTAGKKKITAKWKKVTGIKGYQLQYSTSKSFSKKSTKSKTIKSYKTTKMTISKLKAKKYYYVRVRTYKTVDGKTVYSGWSASKKAKTK